jgi:hypothetical protein
MGSTRLMLMLHEVSPNTTWHPQSVALKTRFLWIILWGMGFSGLELVENAGKKLVSAVQ